MPLLYWELGFVPREVSSGLNYWREIPSVWPRFLAWLVRRLPNEQQRLLAFTILAGGLCGLAAVAFHLSIGLLEKLLINRANAAMGHSWIFWTIVTPGLGALAVGLGLQSLGLAWLGRSPAARPVP